MTWLTGKLQRPRFVTGRNRTRRCASRSVSPSTATRRLRIEPLEDRRLLSVIPNDPLFSEQWPMHNTGQTGGTYDADIDAPAAWWITTGDTSMVIAVIDAGVDYTHEDLYLNIWLNQGEIPATFASNLTDTDGDSLITYRDLNELANAGYVSDRNGTGYIDAGDLFSDPMWADNSDTDGNGYVDDISGYDFVDDVHDPIDFAHGTFMAGLIGAVGDNATGVAGVCWAAQIMPLRFYEYGGGNGGVSDAAEAIDYAVANGAQVSNNSWGETWLALRRRVFPKLYGRRLPTPLRPGISWSRRLETTAKQQRQPGVCLLSSKLRSRQHHRRCHHGCR